MTERAYVDRIEGERAVLVLGPEGRETISLPTRLLPMGTQEGAALDLNLTPVPDDTTHAQIDNLMDDLFGCSGG